MSNLRLSEFTGQQMTFVDPTDFRSVSKVRWSRTVKGALGVKGVTLDSSKWSLRSNARPVVPMEAESLAGLVREDTSIFTEVSYSVQNKAKFLADLDAHIANLRLLATDLAGGLPPSTEVVLVSEVTG